MLTIIIPTMIKVATLVKLCGGFPSSWEGETDDDRYLYARYRSGYLMIEVAPSFEAWQLEAGEKFLVVDEPFGDELDGILTYAQLQSLTGAVIEWPATEPTFAAGSVA